MHLLNPYLKTRPDFAALATRYPDFKPYVKLSPSGHGSIDFQDASALRALTKTLLKEDWHLDVELRNDRLCPTLANRLDYVLSILDLEPYLALDTTRLLGFVKPINSDTKLRDSESKIRILDIGTGHVAIYPLLSYRLRPSAKIIATELDEVSFNHAKHILEINGIASSSIEVLRAEQDGPLLFSLGEQEVDVVMCNPPFFSSAEEIKEGIDLKMAPAPAGSTIANNESITPGGEVEFVGKIISESTRLQRKCKWFTSLIGKYSSLQPLVELLKSFEIDNYFVKSIKQATTTRWIIGWSYGHIRLPDTLTRPGTLMPNTSYTKLLPPPNDLLHTPLHPPLTVEQLEQAILPVLKDCQMLPSQPGQDDASNAVKLEDGFILLRPKGNTWSRAARRAAARQVNDQDVSIPEAESTKQVAEPVMICLLKVVPPSPPNLKSPTPHGAKSPSPLITDVESTPVETADAGPSSLSLAGQDSSTAQAGSWKGASISLQYVYGKDRELVDSFWKYLLTKGNLLGAQGGSGQATKHSLAQESWNGAGTNGDRGQGRGSGSRGARGFRGRGRGDLGWRGRRGI